MNKGLQTMNKGLQPQAASGVQHQFQKNSPIEIWSKSQRAWCPGVVLATHDTAVQEYGYKNGVYDLHHVPAGSYQVMHSDNSRPAQWVRPEEVQEMLRPAPSHKH